MAKSLDDPGKIPDGGAKYVSEADNRGWKLPTMGVYGGFESENLDTTLSLTGDKQITLGNAGDPLDDHQADVPTASPFTVKPSELKTVEKNIITELDTLVGAYPAFKSLIQDTEGWIFLVRNPADLVPYEQAVPGGYYAQYSGTQTKANYTDPDPESTQRIVDSQNALVRALGDTYQLVGEMAAVLNNAAQNYVKGDKVVFGSGTNVDEHPF
jgi:hypothetical protein